MTRWMSLVDGQGPEANRCCLRGWRPATGIARRPLFRRLHPGDFTLSGLLFLMLVVPLVASLVTSCISEDAAGTGTVSLALNGGMALTHGFPHQEGDTLHQFVDGWQVSFTKWVLVLGDLELSDPSTGVVDARWEGTAVMDLMKHGGQGVDWLSLDGVPARRLQVAFLMAPVDEDTIRSVKADPEDVDRMVDEGWNVFIEGEARRGEEEVRFSFGLSVLTRYERCINGKDRTEGLAVERNKTTGAYLFSHPHHLFWTTLGHGAEDLRFDAFAAVARDGMVTEDDLIRQHLANLQDAEGNPLRDHRGHRVFYNDAGRLHPDALTLRHFLEQALQDSIHFNGVGLCRTSTLQP